MRIIGGFLLAAWLAFLGVIAYASALRAEDSALDIVMREALWAKIKATPSLAGVDQIAFAPVGEPAFFAGYLFRWGWTDPEPHTTYHMRFAAHLVRICEGDVSHCFKVSLWSEGKEITQ